MGCPTSMRRRVTRGVALGVVMTATALGLAPAAGAQPPRVGAAAPDVTGGPWINSAPLTLAGLRGRVVAVEFWTYG